MYSLSATVFSFEGGALEEKEEEKERALLAPAEFVGIAKELSVDAMLARI